MIVTVITIGIENAMTAGIIEEIAAFRTYRDWDHRADRNSERRELKLIAGDAVWLELSGVRKVDGCGLCASLIFASDPNRCAKITQARLRSVCSLSSCLSGSIDA